MEKREQHEEISASNVETRTAGSRIFASFAVFAERDFSKFYILPRESNKTHSNSPKMENASVAGALPSECYLIKFLGGRATRVCSFQTRSIPQQLSWQKTRRHDITRSFCRTTEMSRELFEKASSVRNGVTAADDHFGALSRESEEN